MDEIIAWLGNSSEWTLAESAAWYGAWLYLSLLVFLAGRNIRIPLITPAWNFIHGKIDSVIKRFSRGS